MRTLRESKVDFLTTQNQDMRQRRTVNAAASVDDNDYVIRKELLEHINKTQESVISQIVNNYGVDPNIFPTNLPDTKINNTTSRFTSIMASLLAGEQLSVKSAFNAIGDGVTDDTASIQYALSAISSMGGGRLFFPRGTYLITSPLSIPSGCEIYGEGDVSIIKRGANMTTNYGVLNSFAGNCAIRNLLVEGNVTTPTGVNYNRNGGVIYPYDADLIANSSIWIHGCSNVIIDGVTIKHTGGYAIYLDAMTSNVSFVYIHNCNITQCRPFLAGTSDADLNYGFWVGGIHWQGDAAGHYASNIYINSCMFKRLSGNACWGHSQGFAYPHKQVEISECFFEDCALDGILLADQIGGAVTNNLLHRIGYVTKTDNDTPTPKWLAGVNATGIDTSGRNVGTTYSGNILFNINGGPIDGDGIGEGSIDNNIVYYSEVGDDDYTNDDLAHCGPNGDGTNLGLGINCANNYNIISAGRNTLISSNLIINCALGGIRTFGHRDSYIINNIIRHPVTTAPPITIGTCGAGTYQTCNGNVVSGNRITWTPAVAAGAIKEDNTLQAFSVSDKNWIYNNHLSGNCYEFDKDSVTKSCQSVDTFMAFADDIYQAAAANKFPDTIGLIRYNSSTKKFQQSLSVSAGVRVWTNLDSPWLISGSDLYYTAGNIGIGGLPTRQLTVVDSVGVSTSGISVFRCYDGTGSPIFTYYKSRGNYTSPTTVQNGDVLAQFSSYARDPSGSYNRFGAFAFISNGTVGSGSVPTDLIFNVSTTGINDITTDAIRLRLFSSGSVGIGGNTYIGSYADNGTATKLQVSGDISLSGAVLLLDSQPIKFKDYGGNYRNVLQMKYDGSNHSHVYLDNTSNYDIYIRPATNRYVIIGNAGSTEYLVPNGDLVGAIGHTSFRWADLHVNHIYSYTDILLTLAGPIKWKDYGGTYRSVLQMNVDGSNNTHVYLDNTDNYDIFIRPGINRYIIFGQAGQTHYLIPNDSTAVYGNLGTNTYRWNKLWCKDANFSGDVLVTGGVQCDKSSGYSFYSPNTYILSKGLVSSGSDTDVSIQSDAGIACGYTTSHGGFFVRTGASTQVKAIEGNGTYYNWFLGRGVNVGALGTNTGYVIAGEFQYYDGANYYNGITSNFSVSLSGGGSATLDFRGGLLHLKT